LSHLNLLNLVCLYKFTFRILYNIASGMFSSADARCTDLCGLLSNAFLTQVTDSYLIRCSPDSCLSFKEQIFLNVFIRLLIECS
jgi:hypothetical protein